MQRVSSDLSKESKAASRSPSAAHTPQNQGSSPQVGPCKDSLPTACGTGFQMKMDAQGFTPEELMVQVDGQWLMVTGQRQVEGCSSDGGGYFLQQKVQRQMPLPPDLDPTAMTCSMTPSGYLCIQGQCQATTLPASPDSSRTVLKT
ncbi:heat shock protein beta-9 [Erinaceus europaeus]|uniref:Heat shock protein beta-9 n=1 Tax=Erinaceus europaeus TaxID=9365 RepID=A0A1S3AHC4_ERIEU|nr:heat shock protein beta-9 [Erinaceus europaeus]